MIKFIFGKRVKRKDIEVKNLWLDFLPIFKGISINSGRGAK